MRKVIAVAALGVVALGVGSSSAADRACDEHGGYTSGTGFAVGTYTDHRGQALEVCSADGQAPDGVARVGASVDKGAYVAVDGADTNGAEADGYVYVTVDHTGVHAWCGDEGSYERETDEGRTDTCA